MASWTAQDIPDQTGRTAVVTGANSGIGFHTALELARKGAAVVLACRDAGRGGAALSRLRAAVPAAEVELGTLDLADLTSVHAFAADLLGRHETLDLLVNNAGVMAVPQRHTTAQGFELQLGTNHLGHFALTGLLLPALLAQPGARVVTVSSGAHKSGQIDFADLQGERNYGAWSAYGQAKLANLMFALELDRRLRAVGAGTLSDAAHPGYAATNLQVAGPQMDGKALRTRMLDLLTKVVAQSDAQGALPTLYAATSPQAVGGGYYGPSGLGEMRGHPKAARISAKALDSDTARQLWTVSEELTGVRYETFAS